MSDTQITPDDPRLTAFALGELDGDEANLIAAAVAQDPVLQAAVDEVRAMAGELEGAFASETLPEVTSINLAQVAHEDYPLDSRKIVRFPYFWVAGLMAAGFAVIVAFYDDGEMHALKDRVVTFDLDLSSLPASDSSVVNLPPVVVEISRPKLRGEWLQQQGEDTSGLLWSQVSTLPVSVFGVRVNPGNYDEIRRTIEAGALPRAETVQLDGLVNAFPYDYLAPLADEASPVAADVEVAAAPWAPEHKLVRVGLKARDFGDDVSTSRVVADQVGVRVEFNPLRVASYRLLGYEGQSEATDAERDAATVGDTLFAGQEVTALYEVVPLPPVALPQIGEAAVTVRPLDPVDDVLVVVHVRARSTDALEPGDWSFSLEDGEHGFDTASEDFRFAASVAGFGLVLKDSPERGAIQLEDVRRWADEARQFDPDGKRSAFVDLIDRADVLIRM